MGLKDWIVSNSRAHRETRSELKDLRNKVENFDNQLDFYHKRLGEIEKDIESLQSSMVESEDLESLRDKVSELKREVLQSKPVTVETTPRERQVLEIFLNSDEYLSARDVADKIEDLTKSNANSVLYRLREKVDFDKRTDPDTMAKEYKLPRNEKDKILRS